MSNSIFPSNSNNALNIHLPNQERQVDSLQVKVPQRVVHQGSQMITAQASPVTVRRAASQITPHP